MDPLEAYELLGVACELRVGNLVNPNFTVVAKIANGLIDQLANARN